MQTVWTQTRPDKMSGLVWIQAVWHSDLILKQQCWKNLQTKNHEQLPSMQIFKSTCVVNTPWYKINKVLFYEPPYSVSSVLNRRQEAVSLTSWRYPNIGITCSFMHSHSLGHEEIMWPRCRIVARSNQTYSEGPGMQVLMQWFAILVFSPDSKTHLNRRQNISSL